MATGSASTAASSIRAAPLLAHWVPAVGLDAEQRAHLAFIPRDAGLTVIDDWSGFGQRTTASGTVILTTCGCRPSTSSRCTAPSTAPPPPAPYRSSSRPPSTPASPVASLAETVQAGAPPRAAMDRRQPAACLGRPLHHPAGRRPAHPRARRGSRARPGGRRHRSGARRPDESVAAARSPWPRPRCSPPKPPCSPPTGCSNWPARARPGGTQSRPPLAQRPHHTPA